MASSTSSSRPLIIAALVIALIEASIALAPVQGRYRGEFFEFAFQKAPNLSKVVVYEKLEFLAREPSEIVFVGDSAALYGVQPQVIMRHLQGERVVNLGCCGNLGFDGYQHVAETALRRNSAAHMLVLYMTPRIGPLNFPRDEPLARAVESNYLGWRQHLALPSFRWRLLVANALFYGRFDELLLSEDRAPKMLGIRTLPGFPTTESVQHQIRSSGGWIPLEWQRPVGHQDCDQERVVGKLIYTPAYARALRADLEQFRELTRRHGVELAIMFNPVTCSLAEAGRAAQIRAMVERFGEQHREVWIPFEIFERWSLDQFADPSHLRPAASTRRSRQIGRLLRARLVGREEQ